MTTPRLRRLLAPTLLVAALVGCGRDAPEEQVRVGAPAQESTSTTAAAFEAPTTTTAIEETSTTLAALEAPTTTVVAGGDGGTPAASVVDGLTPADVRSAVAAPVPATTRRLAGPTLDRVTLASGATAWRVRIPGAVPARSARVVVSVGEREVGTGIVTPELDALVAITTDGTGLVAGAEVRTRWEGSDAVAAGRLGVAR